ncbi:ATP-binding protein [Nocardioides sp. 31GB23]|uniref:Serine/threonine-protein kinase RsbW n=1 Tax=Nocardioides salarius TaxID=374513 RepID=A0ABS2MGL5_9ACTN|nr:ATP-binding protein [Nocardioides salarius]MBM7510331.1 serine/threonine-protein kinase RsbW [Nocardioides salarius]
MTEGSAVEPGLDQIDDRLELSAAATPEILDLVHALLEHLLAQREDVDASARMRFEMSVIEILSNIVEHAYQADSGLSRPPGGSRRFTITLAVTATRLIAALSDNGLPMSLDLETATMPDDLAESGRGLAMATAALDALEYERVEGRNRWHLMCLHGAAR